MTKTIEDAEFLEHIGARALPMRVAGVIREVFRVEGRKVLTRDFPDGEFSAAKTHDGGLGRRFVVVRFLDKTYRLFVDEAKAYLATGHYRTRTDKALSDIPLEDRDGAFREAAEHFGWAARITVSGKRVFLGRFLTRDEAHASYIGALRVAQVGGVA